MIENPKGRFEYTRPRYPPSPAISRSPNPPPPSVPGPFLLQINEGAHLELESKELLPYTLVKNLGHGASASVEMVQDMNTSAVFARKLIRNVYARNLQEAKQNFLRELGVMRRLGQHHHIVKVFATYIAKRELALILSPVADQGDLAAFLHDYQDTHPTDSTREPRAAILRKAFGCLASGLEFMYQQTVRHKDIKPQNILVHNGSVLYTDFGISLDFSQSEQSTTIGYPQAFTRRYCAPEVADWGRRNSKADVFSLGCVYIEIMSALFPTLISDSFLEGPFYQKIAERCEPFYSKSAVYESSLPHITLSMLKLDSTERPSASAVTGRVLRVGQEWFCNTCSSRALLGGDIMYKHTVTRG